MRISKWLSTKKSLDCYTNSPCLCLRKCFENSVENMHTDVRDLRVKSKVWGSFQGGKVNNH